MEALHYVETCSECAFLCLAPLWGHMCEEGEERMDGGRGAETPFTACPVEMAAVIPLTETVLC